MPDIKKLEEVEQIKTFTPSKDEQILQTFVKKRAEEMMAYRDSLKLEKEWKEADEEYIPHEIDFGTTKKRFEADQDTGLRSRMVPIGGSDKQAWRSNNSAPTLLAKIQTALSIIIDQNPEAMLTALQKKYEKRTEIAYSLWKRNWSITNSKETLKLFVFDLIKYGWATGRSNPRKISYTKEILTEVDTEDPTKNKYESKELVWFNDVARQRLSPFTTWIDEQTKPYDVYSMNDCYYELDFSYDSLKLEMGDYKNFEFVAKNSKVVRPEGKEDSKEEDKTRKDIVTIGFYENRVKDLFVIRAVKDNIILYSGPLPNDDGYLSIWHTMWILKNSDTPYGISLWQIIKQDKSLYDKMQNMTMDQLVLSIMKVGFHTGTSMNLGDSTIDIEPGVSKQIINGEVKWMEIPGPGKDSFAGLEILAKNMDDASGVTPTLQGEAQGATLGEIQLTRESSLKRLKVPLENIADAIEQDAYLTLSWMKQIYSVPEVMEFTDENELMEYEAEEQMEHSEVMQQTDPETGQPMGLQATFLPQLSLQLEDRNGDLFESKESKFFQLGAEGGIQPKDLDWKGIFKVIPRSILGTSEIIMKQTKGEIFNLIVPLLQMPPELVKPAIVQLLKVNEEDPKDWLPDIPGWNDMPVPPPMMGPDGQPLPPGADPSMGAPGQGGPTVVPKGEVSGPTKQQKVGGLGSIFTKKL